MKTQIFTFFFALLLIACNEAPIKKNIIDKYSNNQAKTIEFTQDIDGKTQIVKQEAYHPNGNLKMEGALKNGKRHGEWKAFFENGKVQSIGEFENGLRNGNSEVYYPNGKLMYKGPYKEEKKVGVWKFYNQKGELVKEEKY